MGYRVVKIMADFFFESIFTKDDSEFQELLKLDEGLPSDAKFVELRASFVSENEIGLVFHSNEWSKEDNYDIIDVRFESITYQQENLDKIIQVASE